MSFRFPIRSPPPRNLARSGINLVKHMQRAGDIKKLDNVRPREAPMCEWTTMTSYMYVSKHFKSNML